MEVRPAGCYRLKTGQQNVELGSETMSKIARVVAAAVVAGVTLAAVSIAAFAGSEFEGTWAVTNTAGKPFEITLSADGNAKATMAENMEGTWKEEDGAAVISWNTGWTTKIAKEGDHYVKTAFKKGESEPANTSDAIKK
jgi:carbon monoxide dehydrogenase subunit G